MVRTVWMALVLTAITGQVSAQDFYQGGAGYQPAQDYEYGQEYLGAGSVGSNEPLFPYDDQSPWKHGYLQIVPYYGGYHSGRPYNYHHVFAQTQTSVGWGMPHGLPYSQQWWTRFEPMGDPGRAQTEPNGYYGYVAPSTNYQWAAAPNGPPANPDLSDAALNQASIAPVQYQSAPVPYQTVPVQYQAVPVQYQAVPVQYQAAPVYQMPAGAIPQGAQSQQLRQYLAAPAAY